MYSVAMVATVSGAATAQNYPFKTVRIVTAPAGGGNDFAARLIAPGLSENLGQSVIVDNRAGGVIPGEIVSKAPADGYTLLFAGGSFLVGHILQDAPYDPVTDFLPITLTGMAPNILVVHPSLPVKSVKDLIDLAKAKPGELNYGSATPGSQNHLAVELFKFMAGVNIVRIAYKGTGPSIIALVAGEVQMMCTNVPSVAPHLKSGRLRALALTTSQPSALFPGLPTVAASGLPGYEVVSVDAIFAPARTPAVIISRLNHEIVRVLNRPDVKQKFFDSGVEVVGSSPEDSANKIKSEISMWGKLIRENAIKSD